jgi:membrane protein implicated in regulation of membrane protease activity
MADSTLWWLAAGALIAAELATGTFYLLMIAAGLACAALAAHFGLASTGQWMVAALTGSGSILIWRFVKKSRPPSNPASSNPDVNLDIGETVHVTTFRDDGTCTVYYRGAQWDAALASGDTAQAGPYNIVEVVGSRLILKPAKKMASGA